MPSIPASQLANVIPGVLGTGGSPLSLNAVFLTNDPSIPIGTVQAFSSSANVSSWFGATATEAVQAAIYFSGYTGCKALPQTLYFAQYNTAAVAAYLRGGSVSALTLAQLQALSGTLAVTVNGELITSSAINLSSATSFSNAATLIQTALQTTGNKFVGTATCVASSPTVTIVSTTSGSLAVGDTIVMTGVPTGSTITAFGTYTTTAGTGTVTISQNATSTQATAVAITSTILATVTYDTLRQAFVVTSPTTGALSTMGYATAGALANGLFLTAATGAVLSQGAAAATPAGIMNQVVSQTQNFATFMTVTEQSLINKQAFATWVQGTNQRYLYVVQDSDPSPTLSSAATGSFGYIINAAQETGVMPIYDISGQGQLAAFICGLAASINFATQNGRTTAAFRGQSGLAPQVTNQTVYNNLVANGYNCYASFATANQLFTEFQPGQISGPFQWFDTYIDQIWLNAQFQLALMSLMQNVPAVPYVSRGYALIRSALVGNAATQNTQPTGPIEQGLYFGAIVSGVQLSGAQSAALNAAAGDSGATATIQNTGWYLQINDPGAVVRGNRGSPTLLFWYTDGGSVQKLVMSSIDVI